MAPERRYSDEEVARILDDATQVTSSGDPAHVSATGMTLSELQDIGREVGIEPDVIASAASRLDQAPALSDVPTPHRSFLGTTIGVGRTVYLDRTLTDDEWNRLVVELRETFDARGKLGSDGPFRQWTNGNLQALLEPTETGSRLRLKTLKGSAVAQLGSGAVMLTLAPILVALALVSGVSGIRETLAGPLFLAVMGAVMFGSGRLTLPSWARTRQLQMDGIAERLAERVNGPDRILEAAEDDPEA